MTLFVSSMEESLGLNHHSPLINEEKKKEFVLDDAFKIIGFMKCYFILFLNVEFLWAFLVTKDWEYHILSYPYGIFLNLKGQCLLHTVCVFTAQNNWNCDLKCLDIVLKWLVKRGCGVTRQPNWGSDESELRNAFRFS